MRLFSNQLSGSLPAEWSAMTDTRHKIACLDLQISFCKTSIPTTERGEDFLPTGLKGSK